MLNLSALQAACPALLEGELVAHMDLVSRAGLVDLDVTFFIQFTMFLALVLVLPKLLFNPLLDRLEHRDSRTDGARTDARRMLKEADAQVLIFEKATSDQKQTALAERAAARESAHQKAQGLIAHVRAQTDAEVQKGIADLRQDADQARADIDSEAAAISVSIADKILTGGSAAAQA